IAICYDGIFKSHAKGKLLDLGCGKVPLFEAYRDYVSEIICVDWENTLHKNEYLDYVCDLTKTLPFSDGEFDTIVLSDVLEHIPEPEMLWKEMERILAFNGKIIMNVPFFYWIHEQPHDYYRYTEFALRRFVEKCKLNIVELFPIGGVFEIFIDLFSKCVVRLPVIGGALAEFSQWAAFKLNVTKFETRLSKSTSASFPLGYFLVAEKKIRTFGKTN